MPDIELEVSTGAAVDVTVNPGALVDVTVTDVVRAALKEDVIQGRQHVEQMRGWAAGLTGTTPRVVVSGDSMMELGSGFNNVWATIQKAKYGANPAQANTSPIWWWPANWLNSAFFRWPVFEGVASTDGIDRRGTTLDVGESAGFNSSNTITCDGIEWFYTAHTGGADAEIRIDGVLVATVDTSTDENGSPVAADTPHQRWASDSLGWGAHYPLVTAAGTGTVRSESFAWLGENGLKVYGVGTSGISTASLVTNGDVVAFVQAMVDRGEPPHLIILGADTADSGTSAALVASNTTLVNQLRTAVHGSTTPSDALTIAYWIGTNHNGRSDWGNDKVPAFLDMCIALNLVPLNAYAAMGDVSNGADPNNYSSDGVHHSAAGQAANTDMILGALFSRSPQATPAALQAQVDDADADLAAHLADTSDAHDASAISYAGGTGMSATDVEAAIDELATEKANLSGGSFTGDVTFQADDSNRVVMDNTSGPPSVIQQKWFLTGDTNPRIELGTFFGLPFIAFGGGSGASDAQISRLSAAVMTITGKIQQATAPSSGDDLTNKTYVDRRRRLTASTTPVGNIGTGNDTLRSLAIAGGTLAADNDVIYFESSGTLANNADAKSISVTFGGSTIFGTGALPTGAAADWQMTGRIARSGASAQKCTVVFTWFLTAGTGTYVPKTVRTTTAIDTSSSRNLVITGNGVTTDNVISEDFFADYVAAS